MVKQLHFHYKPTDEEAEKASNSYLMSLIAIIVGLPIPIINLIATFGFFLANRKGSYFVRWHCTQALFSQLSVFVINSIGFWWTISIIFRDGELSNNYFAYIIILFLFNLTEFIATIYTAIKIRKGTHLEWWLYGALTIQACKPQQS